MDFKRVERILLIAFLALNIFLIYIMVERTNSLDSQSSSQSVNLTQEMSNSGIELPDLSSDSPSLTYLQAESQTFSEDALADLTNQTGSLNEEGTLYSAILSEPIELSDEPEVSEEDRQKTADFVNSNYVWSGDQYEFFDYQEETGQIVYTQMVNNTPIADGTSSIRLMLDSENNIISYEQTYAGPMTEQGDPLTLLSEKAAVELLFQNNRISANSIVYPPRLTYYRTLNMEELSMYIPSWYIKIESSGQVIDERVNAVDGTIIGDGTSSLPTTESQDSTSNMEESITE